VVLLQSNVGFWACGQISKEHLIFINYLALVVGCGLVGGSQIVRKKVSVLHWTWNCAKECGLLGFWADWKRTFIFVIVSLWLWAVDL
jgi:hypothetical protein